MARKDQNARTRLQSAALELFRKRGFERTTAAEIAALAGVTERTFFRHFPDKREVLFDGEAILRTALTASISEAPTGMGALDTLFRAFRSVQPLLEANRSFAKPRYELILATSALHERELAKHAALADALAVALKARSVADLKAVLAAKAGMAAFVTATIAWLDDPNIKLGERMNLAFSEMKAVMDEGDEAAIDG